MASDGVDARARITWTPEARGAAAQLRRGCCRCAACCAACAALRTGQLTEGCLTLRRRRTRCCRSWSRRRARATGRWLPRRGGARAAVCGAARARALTRRTPVCNRLSAASRGATARAAACGALGGPRWGGRCAPPARARGRAGGAGGASPEKRAPVHNPEKRARRRSRAARPRSWFNQLNPALKHDPFTEHEEATVRARRRRRCRRGPPAAAPTQRGALATKKNAAAP